MFINTALKNNNIMPPQIPLNEMDTSSSASRTSSPRSSAVSNSNSFRKPNLPPPGPRGSSPAPSPAASPCFSSRKSPVASSRQQPSYGRRPSLSSTGSFDSGAGNPSTPPRQRLNSGGSVSSHQSLSSEDLMKILTKALRRNISRYGETHPTTAQIYNQIGNLYFRQGDWASAAVHYKFAVRCGGGEQLSAAYSNLGTVYWRRGEIETAIDYLHRALAVQPNLDTAGTASIHHQLGVCYALSNDTKNAIASLEKARAIRIRILGTLDVAVALTNDAIGKVLCMQNKFDEAMACHQQALVCFQNAGIVDTSGTWLNMVHVHLAVGNRDAALAALQEACRIQKSVGIDSNKSKATLHVQTLQMMARIYEETGNTTKAEELRQEADLVYKTCGLHDPNAEL